MKAFLNPGVVGVTVGLILFFAQIRIPPILSDIVGYVASLNTPLAMIATGTFLAQVSFRETVSDGRTYVVALLRLPFADRGFLIPLFWLAFCSAIVGFFLANVAIAKAGVNRSASFIGVATLVAVVAGAAILGETFTVQQTAAALLILAGVWIANSLPAGADSRNE